MKKDQNGFGLVEGLLVVIALVLVVFVGYYVWNNQTKKDSKTTSTTAATTNPATTSSVKADTTTSVVKIPELGVALTLPKHFADLTYHYQLLAADESGKPAKAAYLSTATLAGLDTQCSADNVAPLGVVVVVDGSYQQPVDDGSNLGMLIKQFSQFNVSYAPQTQAACSLSDSVMATVTAEKVAFNKALNAAAVTEL